MGKANPMNQNNNKGQKRKSTNELVELDELERSNGKQKPRDGKRIGKVVKKLDFDDDGSSKRTTRDRKPKSTKAQVISTSFQEDGDTVQIEVDGQNTEFSNEDEPPENMDNTESESEDGEVNFHRDVISQNNNATKSMRPNEDEVNQTVHQPRPHCSKDEEPATPGEVYVIPRDPEQDKMEEEAGMQRFIDYMKKKGMVMVQTSQQQQPDTKTPKKHSEKSTMRLPQPVRSNGEPNRRDENSGESGENESVVTIYRNAVKQVDKPSTNSNKFDSSSSDETGNFMDSSDEYDKLPIDNLNITNEDVAKFISDIRRADNVQRTSLPMPAYYGLAQHGYPGAQRRDQQTPRPMPQPQPPNYTRSEELIRNAEAKTTRMYEVQGKAIIDDNSQLQPTNPINDNSNFGVAQRTYHSALLDEDYLLVGNYVDEITKKKIGNGEYVDFAKLMPKDRGNDEDQRMEMINKGGLTFWVPASDCESTAISSYYKWEQAFRVFSNIYTGYHPGRGGELIQYHHTIHTAAQTFVWDNVYRYDKEFRIHMTRYHLHRSWGVILQQAWSMFLKDRIGSTPSSGNGNFGRSNGNTNNGARRRLCYDFNSGHCTFGKKCKFDHRCSFCNKFGHGSFNCRRANRPKGSGGSNGSNGSHGDGGKPKSNHNKNEGGNTTQHSSSR